MDIYLLIKDYERYVEATTRNYYFLHNGEASDVRPICGRLVYLRSFFHDVFWQTCLDNSINAEETFFRQATAEEIEKFGKEYNFLNGYKCSLIGVLTYRDHIVPVYDDDYGQSVFCIYGKDENGEDRIYNSGSFNFEWAMELMHQLDFVFDIELIKAELARLAERDL